MQRMSAATFLLCSAGLLCIAGAPLLQPARAEGPLRERLRARMTERMATQAAADMPEGGVVLRYGADPAQSLRYWKAQRPAAAAAAAARSPLIVFVHGGGWRMGSADNATGKAKIAHLTGEGYAVASIDYRLVPSATVEEQAQDVAASLAYLLKETDGLGFDPGRVVLMGHSAGAHLVTLVGTDAAYLKGAGLPLSAVRGVIALDGAAYDVPAQMQDGPKVMQSVYQQAFGMDPARQAALSPTRQAAPPNAPAFLLLHVQRADGTRQAAALAKALQQAGTPVTIRGFDGEGLKGHMTMNRSLGDPAYPATAAVDDWLRQIVR
jgi:acetyl esterase/lipase